MPVSYDTVQIAEQMREKSAALRDAALADAGDDIGHRKFIEAQAALTEATIMQSQILAELVGAGMPIAEIIKVFAAHSSNILASLLSFAPPGDSEAREAILALFMVTQRQSATADVGHRASIEIRGTPGGRA